MLFNKKWWKACAIRMVRTFAEAALAYIGTGAVVLGDVNWIACLSAGAMGAVLAFLLALASLPEVVDERGYNAVSDGWPVDDEGGGEK